MTALGRDARPALWFVCQHARDPERLDFAQSLFVKIARPEDTRAIWKLYEPLDRKFGNRREIVPGDGIAFRSWLRDNGEPEFVGRIYFPRFQSADLRGKQDLLPFILRSPEKPVVDALFGILKDPKADPYLRSTIYGSLARCGRTDVLDWLYKNRNFLRR